MTAATWPAAGWARRAASVTDETGSRPGGVRPVAIVTGASSGLGLAAAQRLVAAGATVILACRNRAKGEQAAARCTGAGPGKPGGEAGETVAGETVVGELDVARPASVEAFSHWFADRYDRLDLLVNNAGVMAPPPSLTPEGIELQWATNHLGHFALTGRLLDRLAATPGSRVVAVSSLAAASGRLRGYDPTSLTGYSRFPTYANSKLANLVFALELDRRLNQAGLPVMALAAHPGVTHTNLTAGMTRGGILGQVGARAMAVASRFTTQSVGQGVQPILRAATDPEATGGRYYGPAGLRQYRGPAVEVPLTASAADPSLGPELWAQSIELSGVEYLT